MGTLLSKRQPNRIVRIKKRQHLKQEIQLKQNVPTLYVWSSSAPCRGALMTVHLLDALVNIVQLDVFNDEHLTKDYLKINPHHTVPAFRKEKFNLWESRAIAEYLVNTVPDTKIQLIPFSIEGRAVMRQFLAFDSHTLHPDITDFLYPQLALLEKCDYDKENRIENHLSFLEKNLQDHDYIVDNTLTLADIFIACTVSLLELVNFELENWPNLYKWLCKIESQPYYVPTNLGHETWKIVLAEKKQYVSIQYDEESI